jgi:hypothetical protein
MWVPGVSSYWREPLPVRELNPSDPTLDPPQKGTSLPAGTLVKCVGSQGGFSVAISYWLLTLAFLIPPTIHLLPVSRWRAQRTKCFFTSAAILSSILFVSAVAVWVRSHWEADAIFWTRGDPDGGCFILCTAEGRVTITCSIYPSYRLGLGRYEKLLFYAPAGSPDHAFSPGNSFWGRLGFDAFEGSVFQGVSFPIGIPTILLAVVPVIWVRTKRSTPGHCPRCDYNLKGNTSAVCPECGLALKSSDFDVIKFKSAP